MTTPTRITELEIIKFRGFRDQTLKLGANLTVIFGKNGTSKSTLLGMIAQPFSFIEGKTPIYTKAYEDDETDIHCFSERQINNKPFEARYDEIFRMSESDEKSHAERNYEYYLKFSGKDITFSRKYSGHDEKFLVRSEFSKGRFRLVAGSKGNMAGAGNFPHPVIYLGLNRVYPLAISTLDEKVELMLSDEEKQWLTTKYNLIASISTNTDDISISSPKEARKGAYILPKDPAYDFKSASSGQDNLAQILSAILSFRRLNKRLGDKYRGGLLLIDELDCTLHPKSQKELIKVLCEESRLNNIQIVTTSHSTTILETSFYSENKNYIQAVHVTKNFRENIFCIHSTQDSTKFNKIFDDLLHEFEEPSTKLTVLSEDSAAISFLKKMLPSDIINNCDFNKVGSQKDSVETASAEYLKWLMNFKTINEKIPIVYVLDGDQCVTSKNKNAITLPGGTYPEKVLYDFFNDTLQFNWNNNQFNFTGDMCFDGYRQANLDNRDFENEQKLHKGWFAAMSKPTRFGQQCGKAFGIYVKAMTLDQKNKFISNFVQVANNALKNCKKEYNFVARFFADYKK